MSNSFKTKLEDTSSRTKSCLTPGVKTFGREQRSKWLHKVLAIDVKNLLKLAAFRPSLLEAWIIERLDRKLADTIGSNIVEKCDVTLTRAIQPLTSDVLRVLFFLAYFTISVFDYTYWPCFEVKDEEDLLLEKTVRGYKTGRGKKDRVNDCETCESEE